MSRRKGIDKDHELAKNLFKIFLILYKKSTTEHIMGWCAVAFIRSGSGQSVGSSIGITAGINLFKGF